MKTRFHEVVKEKDHVLEDKLEALSRFSYIISSSLATWKSYLFSY